MKPNEDAKALLQERLLHEDRILRAKKQMRKKLSSAYNQYLDVDRDIDVVHHRMSILVGMLGTEGIGETVKMSARTHLEESLEGFSSPQELRQKLKLWRAVREYLRVAGESKISNVQAFLVWIGVQDFTRQALESALQNHQDVFEVTKRGHEKYVGLR